MSYKRELPLKHYMLYFLSGFIPFFLIMVCFYVQEIAPFGHKTILFVDSNTQYLHYLSYLRSILCGENGFLYSFSKNLGGDMISLASYYLLSPFNLLFLFAPTEKLPSFFTLVIVLKIACCGLSFYYASAKKYGFHFRSLAFSTAYALMGYIVINHWNTMWLDAVIILPALGLGLSNLWTERKCGLYIFSIAYALLTSFYTGYMLCIASVIFACAFTALHTNSFKQLIHNWYYFIVSSCIGGFLVAPVWLPSMLALSGGRYSTDVFKHFDLIRFNLLDFSVKFITGAANWGELAGGMPHVFCGTLVLLLTTFFFLNKKIAPQIRITSFVVILIFLISFSINGLDIIWHGFSPNRSFNYRYSFIFTYILIMLGQHSFFCLETLPKKVLFFSPIVILLVYTLAYVRLAYIAGIGFFFSAVAFIILYLCFICPCSSKSIVTFIMVIVSIGEIGINCFLSWQNLFQDTKYLYYPDYYQHVSKTAPVIDYVKNMDSSFYRMEKTFQYSQNDPMLFGYNGLSHFSSTEKNYVLQFLKKMGFTEYRDIWAYYNHGGTAETDSLLGVKYILSESDLSTFKDLNLVSTINQINIFENPNALPVVFLADPEIMSVSTQQSDFFALHNAIWSGVIGESVEILQKENTYTTTYNNLQIQENEEGRLIGIKKDPMSPASIRYQITISKPLPLYFYFDAPVHKQNATILINGKDNGAYFDNYRRDISYAGTYQPGNVVTIEIVLGSDELMIPDAYFYYESLDTLRQVSNSVKATSIDFNQLSSSRFSGSFTAPVNQTLFFTIPYEAGWNLILDGKPVALSKVLDSLIAVDVTAGSHTFELYYFPVGMKLGIFLSISAIITALYVQIKKKSKAIRL